MRAKDSDNCQHAGTEVCGNNFMQITNFNLQLKPTAKRMNKVGNTDAPMAYNRLQVWCTHWDYVTAQNVHKEASHWRVSRRYKDQRITQGYLVRKESLPWERLVRATQSREVSLDGGHGAEMSLPCWLGTLSVDQGGSAFSHSHLDHERLVVFICQPGRRWVLLPQMYEKNFIGLHEPVNRNWFS